MKQTNKMSYGDTYIVGHLPQKRPDVLQFHNTIRWKQAANGKGQTFEVVHDSIYGLMERDGV